MIYKIKTSFRYCNILKHKWEMIDSMEEITEDEYKSIKDKLKEHTNRTGLTWDQVIVYPDGEIKPNRTFIKIPDKIFEVRNTPLSKTVYIQLDDKSDILLNAVRHGEVRYDI